jgi:hypothetical protein
MTWGEALVAWGLLSIGFAAGWAVRANLGLRWRPRPPVSGLRPVPPARPMRAGRQNLLEQIANEKGGSGRSPDPESVRMVPRRNA